MGVLPAGGVATLSPTKCAGFLEELPEALNETYERVLRERIESMAVVSCSVSLSRFSPCVLKKLAEALAIDFVAPAQGGIPQLKPN